MSLSFIDRFAAECRAILGAVTARAALLSLADAPDNPLKALADESYPPRNPDIAEMLESATHDLGFEFMPRHDAFYAALAAPLIVDLAATYADWCAEAWAAEDAIDAEADSRYEAWKEL